jgi:hypothetical protein
MSSSTRFSDLSRRTASYLNVKTVTREEEDNRVFKKRRTSSDVLDEARLFEQEDYEARLAASTDAAIDSGPEADPPATNGMTVTLETEVTP